MSIKIVLDNQPEFYTNLDVVSGRVLLSLSRSEQIGSIVVKLEGESITALEVPRTYGYENYSKTGPPPGPPGSIMSENHKILYKLEQVFPDDYYASSANPYGSYPLQPGQYEWPFKFKLPINNACSDPMAMSRIGGLGGLGGYGPGGGLFGMGGVRVMDGTKQLYLRHVTATLPPSLTGYPMEAEIRYYIKVTIQRPGLLKENWRFQVGFKFLPIEPPRPPITGQEAFARRPFSFRLRTAQQKKRNSIFSKKGSETPDPLDAGDAAATPPSIELAARLPHPAVLTCNKPVPLRLIAKKLVNSPEQVYLISFQMDLIGITEVRAHGMFNRKINRWVVVSNSDISIPLCSPQDEEGKEVEIPNELWRNKTLPNTVAPSFNTCNLSRKYEIELKLGVCWGKPKNGPLAKDTFNQPQTIYLPLHFAQVSVFSGITPPTELLEAARNTRPGEVTLTSTAPRLPPRTSVSGPSTPAASTPASASPAPSRPAANSQPAIPPRPPQDPLYPPQLAPGETPYDDAPPSYDEAMAENLSGPFDGLRPRPAYSGMTNENAPSQMPPGKS